MCLSIPGKIESIELGSSPLMAKVSFGGTVKDICIEYTPDAGNGDYVLVHAGFALNTISEDEAKETLRLIAEIGQTGQKNEIY